MRYAAIDTTGALLGFYSTDLWAVSAMPAGSVPITDAQWATWLANPTGYRWTGTPATLTPYTPPTPPPTVASALAALAALSAAKQSAGVHYQPASLTAPELFATDPASQAHISAAFLLAQNNAWPAGSTYFAADGTPVVFTATEIQSFAIKAGGYVLACGANAAALMRAIATNPATDITQGWPSNQ